MFRRSLLATAALALTIAPVAAQAAQAAPRTSSDIAGEQLGATAWLLIAVGLGLAIWGIVELSSDDEPASP